MVTFAGILKMPLKGNGSKRVWFKKAGIKKASSLQTTLLLYLRNY